MGVRERPELPCPHGGEQVTEAWDQRPRVATEVAQVEAERSPDLLGEHLAGAREHRRVDRTGRQGAAGEPIPQIFGIDANPGDGERRDENGLPAEQLDLHLFGFWTGSERHRAVAKDDESRHACGSHRHEGVAGGHVDLDVFCRQPQIVDHVLCRGVEGELVESVDEREPVERDDQPRRTRQVFEPSEVEAQCRDAPCGFCFAERLDDDPEADVGVEARKRDAVAFPEGRPHGSGHAEVVDRRGDLVVGNERPEKGPEPCRVARIDESLEREQEFDGWCARPRRIGVLRGSRLRGRAAHEKSHEAQQQECSAHEVHVSPSVAIVVRRNPA